MELYSPPGNGIPQELPDRWRFTNGEVRYDLKSLSNYDLSLLDWVGPYTLPVPKQLDEDGNLVSEDYEYDPATHKVAWYKYFRKYVILENQVNELPYQDGELITDVERPDWKKFQATAVASPELNAYIAQLLPICPLVAISIPTAVRDLVNGSYGEFITIWKTITQIVAPPETLINDIIALAKECRLPREFVLVFREQ